MQTHNINPEEKPIINIRPLPTSSQSQSIRLDQVSTKDLGQQSSDQSLRKTQEPGPMIEQSNVVKELEKETPQAIHKSTQVESSELVDESKERIEKERMEKERMETMMSKLDENAEKELPSITEQRDIDVKEYKPEPKPVVQDLPTMEQERDSIIDKELKWEKEHGMLPEDIPQVRVPNPDIRSEQEYRKQHRPSISDEEEEKKSYKLNQEEKPKLYEGKQSEEFKPANKEEAIKNLQKEEIEYPSLENVPLSTEIHQVPKKVDEKESEEFKEKYGKLKLDIKEKHDENAKLSILEPGTEQQLPKTSDEKENEEFKEKFGKLKLDIKEKHDEKAKLSALKTESLEKPELRPEISAEKFDLQEVIDYLNENKHAIEDLLSESDKKKIQYILNLAKDFKSLCEEALETIKNDLLEFYHLARHKFARALAEIKDNEKSIM